MRLKLNLPIKIAIFALFSAGASVLIITFLASNNAERLLSNNAKSLINETQANKVVTLKNTFVSIEKDIHFLTHAGPVAHLINPVLNSGNASLKRRSPSFWQERLIGLFDVILRERPWYNSIYFLGMTEPEKYFLFAKREVESIERKLDASSYMERYLHDINSTKLLSENEYYISALTGVVGDDINEYRDSSEFRIAMPVFTRAGQMAGIMVIHIDIEMLHSIVSQAFVNTFAFLTNEKGNLIFKPEKQQIKSATISADSLDRTLPVKEILKAMDENSEAMIMDLPSLNVGLALHKVFFDPLQKERFLLLGSGVDYEKLYTESTVFRNNLFVFAVVTVVILSLLIAVITAHLTRPIRQLTILSRQIGLGEEDVEIPITSNDEVGELAVAMNTMVSNLDTSKRKYQDLANKLEVTLNQLKEETKEREKSESRRLELEVKTLSHAKLASLGEIATGIAHEINQPLSFIRIFYEATLRDLERGQLNQTELRDDVVEALRQVSRISRIIDHLRIFGRSDSREHYPVRLEKILDDSLILLAESLRIKNISFKKHIEEKISPVQGNTSQLEQVFINLFQNSLDALNDQVGGMITLLIYQEQENIIIRFTDNGPGIPKEILKKVFDPFFTTKEVGKGTGLGLSIIYGIISDHNGSVSCESETDQGTTFLISLPTAEFLEED